MATPMIDPNELVAYVRDRFPSADVGWRIFNGEHGSWDMDILFGSCHLELLWLPLTGFGGIDLGEKARLLKRAGYNPFEPFDRSFETTQQAWEWIKERLTMSDEVSRQASKALEV